MKKIDTKKIAEYLVFKRLITEVYPAGTISIVSDTFSFWEVIDVILPKLKPEIMARAGKVVIRPDSGDPVRIVAGYRDDEVVRMDDGKVWVPGAADRPGKFVTELEVKGMIQCLWETFGGTETSTGYKQLDSHIGAIYGDAITLERAEQICKRLADKGFASTNIVFGIGLT